MPASNMQEPSDAAGRIVLPVKVVVPLVGLPGAGKTVVADHLLGRIAVRRVCRDSIRAAMYPQCSYTMPEKRSAFRAVLLAVEVNCALGASSVIDGMTFSRQKDLQRLADRAREYKAVVVPIWLDVPPHVARERIAKETGPHPAGDRDPDIVNRVLERFEAPPPSVPAIDATLPMERVCELALELVLARAGYVGS
jgi:predicted kinase